MVQDVWQGGRAVVRSAIDSTCTYFIRLASGTEHVHSLRTAGSNNHSLSPCCRYPSPPPPGALPQTFEDPDHKDKWTGLLGDGDPVDVCEIGGRLAKTGEAYQVKVSTD